MTGTELADLAVAGVNDAGDTDELQPHLAPYVPERALANVGYAVLIDQYGYDSPIKCAITYNNKEGKLRRARVCWFCYVNKVPCILVPGSARCAEGLGCKYLCGAACQPPGGHTRDFEKYADAHFEAVNEESALWRPLNYHSLQREGLGAGEGGEAK